MSAPAARPAPAATTRPSSGLQRMSTETSIQATMPQLSTLAHMTAFATSKEMCALMMVSNRSAVRLYTSQEYRGSIHTK